MASSHNHARSTLRKPRRDLVSLPVISNHPLSAEPKRGTPQVGLVRQAMAVHSACGRDPKLCAESLCDYCDEIGVNSARMAEGIS